MTMRQFGAFALVFAAGFAACHFTRQVPTFPTAQPTEIVVNVADPASETGRKVLRLAPHTYADSAGKESRLGDAPGGEHVWVTLTLPRGGVTYYGTVTSSSP